jgi:hypothetical protein
MVASSLFIEKLPIVENTVSTGIFSEAEKDEWMSKFVESNEESMFEAFVEGLKKVL